MKNEIEIDGITYVRKDTIAPAPPTSGRFLLCIDRGWFYAGDAEEIDGFTVLHNAVHLRRFKGTWIDGAVENPTDPRVEIARMPYPVHVPHGAELYRIPLPEGWGLDG